MSRQILIVDDDPAILKLLTVWARRLGHEPLQSQNGWDALLVAQQDLPDLVITDIELPVLDGVELTKHLKADPRLREIPVIAITGGSRGDEALAAGCCVVFPKPFRLDSLASAVEFALQRNAEKGFRPSPRDPIIGVGQKVRAPLHPDHPEGTVVSLWYLVTTQETVAQIDVGGGMSFNLPVRELVLVGLDG